MPKCISVGSSSTNQTTHRPHGIKTPNSAMPTTTSPMVRSVELLHRVLSIFPILHAILSSTHRSAIIHLARTSRALHTILTEAIKRLRNPFPRCLPPLKACYYCQVPVCKDCQHEVKALAGPSRVMSRLGIHRALLSAHRPGSTKQREIFTCVRWLTPTSPDMTFRHGIEIKQVCEPCFATFNENYKNKLIEPAVVTFPVLKWTNMPHSTCKCSNPDCGADQHLVPVESIAPDSQLVAFVEIPPEWKRSRTETMAGVYLPA